MAAIVANTGSNNWNTNGAWVGGVQPTAADDVTIPATAVVTIPAATTALCRSCTVSASGTLAFAATTSVLTIGDATAGTGSVAFSNAGTITLTAIGTINFISTSATVQTVTTGGQTLPNETYNAASNGSWQFADNHTSSGQITLTKGTLDMNGKTVSASILDFNNSNVRTLTLGAANITLTKANSDCLVATATTNLTFNANTSTITSTGTNASFRNNTLTFNNVVFSGGGAITLNKGGNPATYNNLTVTGTAVKTDNFAWDANFGATVNGALSFSGNSTTNRLQVISSVIGTARTITLGASATLRTAGTQNVDFQDITITGGATNERDLSAITGGSGDCQGNTGITFTTAVTRYAVVAGNWSSTATWSATSGGSGGSSVPLSQDTVNLDASSGAGTYVVDMPRMGKDVSWAGFTRTTTLSSTINTLYGNFTLGSGMTAWGGNQGIVLSGRGSQTITMNGFATANDSFNIIAPGGTYTLQDNFTLQSGKSLAFTNGTFDANGKNLSCDGYNINSTMTTVKMGSGTWNIIRVSSGSPWNFVGGATSILQCQTSTIKFNAAFTGNQTFIGNGATYNILDATVAGSTASLIIQGANTFADIKYSDASNARTITFPGSTTTTFTATHALTNMFGSSGKLITVAPSAGTATLAFPNGYGGGSDWLSVSGITATTNTWYAGANSTNGGGNTNVTFTAAPSTATVTFIKYTPPWRS